MDTIEAAVLVMKLNRQITEETNSRFGVLFTNNGIINMRASSVTKAAVPVVCHFNAAKTFSAEADLLGRLHGPSLSEL